MKLQNTPPSFFLKFFRWFCHPKLRNHIEGDLMELYYERHEEAGKRKADIKFVIDVLLLFRPGIIRPAGSQNLNHYSMYKNYFKIGWRNLLKNKGYAFINIGGLALGMTVAMLIGFWIHDELSFNKYHKNYKEIARVYRNHMVNEGMISNMVQPTGLATLLKSDYGTHFTKVVLLRSRIEERVLSFEDNKFTQNGYFMQPEGADLFSLRMKAGMRNGLMDMKSIFLSESLAKKIFGDTDPINQIVMMDAKWELKVTGVYEDLPRNSEFSAATYFAPLDLFLNGWSDLNVWDNYNMHIYVQVHPGSSAEQISASIKDAMLPHINVEPGKQNPELFILPMSDWRLYSQFKNGLAVTSERIKFVWFFGMIGIFVLLLACINFMNLSTARSERRAKEVGIRKSIGSYRSQIISQFFAESLLVALLSFALSLLLIYSLMTSFNTIADKDMSIPWTNPFFWIAGISFSVFTGILAGSYPALYLSSFSPVKVLKGTFKTGQLASSPRRVLVVVQFTVSISLIIATIIVYQQIQFAKNRPMGYSREGLISLHSRSPELKGKYEALRNELKRTGAVTEIAEADYSITSTLGWNGGFEWKGKEKNIDDPTFNINQVTFEYGKTIGWNFIAGRDFSRNFPSDLSGVVINQSAADLMGLKNATGEILKLNRGDIHKEFTILGVISDMVKGSPFEPTDPGLFFLTERDQEWIYIRMNPQISTHEALPKIEAAFKQLISTAPFDYRFADQEYEAKFRAEERVGTLGALFSSLAILISCSGLFGLAAFVAEQRTKEIGIRKILGASVSNLWMLLSSEFVTLVIVSCVISIPLSYYFMNNWLKQYEYHISVTWYVFALAGTGALLLTLLTVSFQAVKAAIANPVRSLRSE